MTGVWPAYTIDHVDLNPFNNSWSNLREATPEQQAANQQKRGDSLLKWVHKVGNRYKARVYANGKRYLLGYYDTPQEAHDAALKLTPNIHGSFARPE